MPQLEAAVWVGLALLLPALARFVWPRAVSLFNLSETGQDLARRLGPWLWGVGPAYLALITGAVPARFFGFTGHSPLVWFGGAILCGALIGFAALVQWPRGNWPAPTLGILDEPRWAFYRAAGVLWIANPRFGLLIGFALVLLEWVIRFEPWKGPLREAFRGSGSRSSDAVAAWSTGTWETVARMAGSTIFFAATRNFWLTALSQAVLLGMMRRNAR